MLTNHEIYDENNNITICYYNSIYYIMNIHFYFLIIDEAHHIQKPRYYQKLSNIPDRNIKYIDIIRNHLQIDYEFYFLATIDNPNFEYPLDKAIEAKYLTDYQVKVHNIDQIKYKSCLEIF